MQMNNHHHHRHHHRRRRHRHVISVTNSLLQTYVGEYNCMFDIKRTF